MRGAFATDGPRYHAVGLNVLPVVPGSKRPVVSWRRWQATKQAAAEVAELIERFPDHDVAVVLGPPGNLVDIETDGPAGEQALRALGLPVPPTAMFTSRRGVHRLYRCTSPLCTRRGLRSQLDVLAANSYVVVPTSTGRAWLTPGGLEAVAPLPEAWAEVLIGTRAGGPALAAAERAGVGEGLRNNTLARLVGRWLTQGIPAAEVLQRARRFAARCTPPLDAREVESVVASVLRTRARGRSPEREALVLGRALGLSSTDRLVLVGLEALRGELGIPAGEPFAAPVRVIATLTGLSRGAVGNAYQRLHAAGVLRLEDGRTPDGRPVTLVVALTPPSTRWT